VTDDPDTTLELGLALPRADLLVVGGYRPGTLRPGAHEGLLDDVTLVREVAQTGHAVVD
jgi:hypothetical protein